MKLFKFEIKKFRSNTKNIILLCLVIIVSLTMFLESNRLSNERIEIIEEARSLADKLMSDENNYREQFPDVLKNYVDGVNKLNEAFLYGTPKNWKKSLEAKNEFIDNISIIQEKLSLDYITSEEIQSQHLNEFYVENNIKLDAPLYGVSGMYFVRLISSLLFSIYGYLFFLFLFFDLFFREIEHNNKNWLVTLPVSYNLFNKNKLILGMCVVAITSITACLSSFIYGYVVSGKFGSLNYPVAFLLENQKLKSLSFLPYFFNSLLVFLIINYGILLFLLYVSRFNINSEKTLAIVITFLVIVSQLSKMSEMNISELLSINYVDLHTSILEIFKNNLGTINGIVTTGCLIFLIGGTYLLLKKKTLIKDFFIKSTH